MQSRRARAAGKYIAKVRGIFDNAAAGSKKEEDVFQDAKGSYEVFSPDGKIRAELISGKQLSYRVWFNGAEVIRTSALGIDSRSCHLGENVRVAPPEVTEVCEDFPDRGCAGVAHDVHNGYLFPVEHVKTGLLYHIELRLWNGGFGFRYLFQKGTRLLVKNEVSSFDVPEDFLCYYQTDLVKMQGKTVCEKAGEMPYGKDICCMATFVVPGIYMMLTESNLYNYAGACLRKTGGGFKIHFWDSNAFFVKDCVSPWRLVILEDSLDSLVNNDVIRASADPPSEELSKADWIKPGKACWSFFVDKPYRSEFSTIMAYNEYGTKLGFDYNIIDEGWRKWGKTEKKAFEKVRQVVLDGEKRGIGVWIWNASVDGLYSKHYRNRFLRRCAAAGVKGLKIDFLESESQRTINFYRDFLEDAAKYRLMVIYHNPNKPTGLSRTYPHLLSREAVRGLQTFCDPDDNTILPFTRFIGGDADYTPYCFTVPDRKKTATIGHMLANTVIFTSSLLTISEHPKNLLGHVSEAFIRALPSTWDETKVLPSSRFAELAEFVRRKGNTWFIAAQQNAGDGRSFELSFDFLSGGDHTLTLWRDGADADTLEKTEIAVDKNSVVAFTLKPCGGFAGIIK
jgi:alpha-glucosidase